MFPARLPVPALLALLLVTALLTQYAPEGVQRLVACLLLLPVLPTLLNLGLTVHTLARSTPERRAAYLERTGPRNVNHALMLLCAVTLFL